MIFYGIRNKKTKVPLGFWASAYHDDLEITLAENTNSIWLVRRESTAKMAMEVDSPWYNSGYETPGWNGLKMTDGTWEVFSIDFAKVGEE